MPSEPSSTPRAGEVYFIGREASVQFGGDQGILFRIIRIQEQVIIATGWAWIEGYQIDNRGYAVERRVIYVQVAGMKRVKKLGGRYVRPAQTE